MVDVKRTTATIVKPPFVAILNVRDPTFRNCDWVRSKLTCPLPLGPPAALYVGTVPTAALFRVDSDANEGFGVSAMNLAHAVPEYDATTLETPEYAPAAQMLHAAAEVAPAAENVPAGQLVHTADVVAPVTPEYVPAGQLVHAVASATMENVPAAHNEHVPPLGLLEPALHVQKGSPALTVLYNVVISAGVSTLLYI